MISKILRAIIVGAPGSGKGTISSRIVRDFGAHHISSGDVLRKQIIQKTAAGLAAKKFMDAGQLVPDEEMVDLFIHEIHDLHGKSWFLDGFPRTVAQAQLLDSHQPPDFVINLVVPFDIIVERIANRWTHIPSGRVYSYDFSPPKVLGKDDVTGEDLVQRDDDRPHLVRERLALFKELTEPVLHYYSDKGMVEEFSGSFTNEIWPRMRKYLCTKVEPIKTEE